MFFERSSICFVWALIRDCLSHNPQMDSKSNGKRKKSSTAFMCCGSSAGASDDSAEYGRPMLRIQTFTTVKGTLPEDIAIAWFCW